MADFINRVKAANPQAMLAGLGAYLTQSLNIAEGSDAYTVSVIDDAGSPAILFYVDYSSSGYTYSYIVSWDEEVWPTPTDGRVWGSYPGASAQVVSSQGFASDGDITWADAWALTVLAIQEWLYVVLTVTSVTVVEHSTYTEGYGTFSWARMVFLLDAEEKHPTYLVWVYFPARNDIAIETAFYFPGLNFSLPMIAPVNLVAMNGDALQSIADSAKRMTLKGQTVSINKGQAAWSVDGGVTTD